MAPIDYSKWDNIDTDSEPEEPAQQAAAPKPTPTSAPAGSTASEGGAGTIEAVIVRCEVERLKHLPWSSFKIPSDHSIFSQQVLPVPGLIGIPLVMHRVGTQSANRAHLDNQIATYLNIDAQSGFAPPQWQSHVGTVIVARKDKKPLLPMHLEGVWMYCSRILDIFGEGRGAPTHLYNRQAFEEWWETYCETMRLNDDGNGGEEDDDDWQDPKSPYDM